MSDANEHDVTVSDASETGATPADDTTPAPAPMLRIVNGNPSDEEVAVLVAVLGSTGGSPDSGSSKPRDLWGTPADRLRPAEPLSPNTFPNLRFGY